MEKATMYVRGMSIQNKIFLSEIAYKECRNIGDILNKMVDEQRMKHDRKKLQRVQARLEKKIQETTKVLEDLKTLVATTTEKLRQEK